VNKQISNCVYLKFRLAFATHSLTELFR